MVIAGDGDGGPGVGVGVGVGVDGDFEQAAATAPHTIRANTRVMEEFIGPGTKDAAADSTRDVNQAAEQPAAGVEARI
jgi:hypothetical protein